MGIIYKITSPEGKKYIGQTIKTFEHRMRQHMNAAKRGDDKKSCKCINRAIRKYGWDNMTKEILFECDDWELNDLEIATIEAEQSLYPNGYNLSKGGAGNVYIQTPAVKEKRSKSMRSRNDTDDLPMYVKYRKTKYGEGYIMERPGYKSVQFTSPDMSMDEKKKLILEYAKEVEKNPEYTIDMKRKNAFDFEVPKYISYQKRIDGFVVNKPGYSRKTFSNKSLTQQENLNNAKTYLESLI